MKDYPGLTVRTKLENRSDNIETEHVDAALERIDARNGKAELWESQSVTKGKS